MPIITTSICSLWAHFLAAIASASYSSFSTSSSFAGIYIYVYICLRAVFKAEQ